VASGGLTGLDSGSVVRGIVADDAGPGGKREERIGFEDGDP